MNDILVPHFKNIFHLSHAQAALVQFSFFMAYWVASIPAGRWVDRAGFRRGMAGGLGLAAAGCLLFLPAAARGAYGLFLAALFVLASGITLLQVAANPYVVLLGRSATASSRLTLTQGFNALGTTLAPLAGAFLILGGAGAAQPEGGAAGSLRGPYLVLGALLAGLALALSWIRLPLGEARPEKGARSGIPVPDGLRRDRPLLLGALGIFCYVGAEVAIGSFLVEHLRRCAGGACTPGDAGRMVSLYWGGAMAGRFLGAAVLRRVAPGRVLAFHAAAAAALVLTAMAAGGPLGAAAMLAVGLFNSILFPTLFSLAVRGRGEGLGQASGTLFMAVAGGAVVPLLLGLAADAVGLRAAFGLPVLCYAYIAFYGLWGHRPPGAAEGSARPPRSPWSGEAASLPPGGSNSRP